MPRACSRAEDDGYVLTVVHDCSDTVDDIDKVALHILDAQNLEGGPVATIAYPDVIAPGLHGCWTERVMSQEAGEPLPLCRDPFVDGL